MPLFTRWRADRGLQRKAADFVARLSLEPDADDIAWLTDVATRGDADHAVWELRYARRALGLLAAERDALDDRTASAVARELSAFMARDRNVAAGMLETAERQFNARLSAYRDGLAARGGPPTEVRMGQTLMAFAGGNFRGQDGDVLRAGELLATYLAESNAALRDIFGAAALPEDVPPSALLRD